MGVVMIEPIVYKWQEYKWMALPSKEKGLWDIHDLNIDHPAARYVDNEDDAKLLAAAPSLLKACLKIAKHGFCHEPQIWDQLHSAIKEAGGKYEDA